MAADAGDASLLRAKYLDWCSAQIADRFLRLPPEEIYELAHEASRDEPGRIDRDSLTVLSLLGMAVGAPAEAATGTADERIGSARPGGPARDDRVVDRAGETSGEASDVEAGEGLGAGEGREAGEGRRAADERDRVPGPYRRLVAQVAERLAVRMDLPDFDEWSAAYREDPERYDRQMLGFWRGPVDAERPEDVEGSEDAEGSDADS